MTSEEHPNPRRATPFLPDDEHPERGPRSRWIPALIVTFAAVGTLGGAWVGWTYWRSVGEGESYATPRGAHRTVTLPDGTQMHLDSATLVERRYSSARRELVLTEGRIALDVPAEDTREFQVVAGDVRLRSVGGQFMVRHTGTGFDPGLVRVEVQEGQVLVAPPGAARVELQAGQAVAAGAGRSGTVEPLPAEGFAAWRDGYVDFRATPLAQALDEFERYGATGVILRDSELAKLPVTGRYRSGDGKGFLESLPAQLPVRLVPQEGGVEIVRVGS